MTTNETIAHSLIVSASLLQRYVADLTPEEFLHRPADNANCTAWLIGHLTLTDRRGLALLGVTDLPALPADFEKRFSRDEGSPQASDFGDVANLMPLFDKHRGMLIDAVKRVAPAQFDKPLETPRPLFKTLGEMINFYAHHTTMHAGQITIIRRSLGRPPLV
jgi:hypothetical protein